MKPPKICISVHPNAEPRKFWTAPAPEVHYGLGHIAIFQNLRDASFGPYFACSGTSGIQPQKNFSKILVRN